MLNLSKPSQEYNSDKFYMGDDGELYPKTDTMDRMPQMNVRTNEYNYPDKADNDDEYYRNPSMKFCKFCGSKIPFDAVVCTACGRQVELLQQAATPPQQTTNIYNNNVYNTSVRKNTGFIVGGKEKNKWVALLLCIFLGYLGVHKFYEGKTGMGLLYLFTAGLGGIGWLIDIIILILKPNPYYLK